MRVFIKFRRAVRYRRLRLIHRYRVKHALPGYSSCKNCDTPLEGMYCHKCGQYALDTNQNFWKFIKQYFDNTFQTDGRALRTFGALITSPGFLSTEFVRGRIMRYVHPLKLYLFCSIVFFAFIFFIVPGTDMIVDQKINQNQAVLIDSLNIKKDSISLLYAGQADLIKSKSDSISNVYKEVIRLKDDRLKIKGFVDVIIDNIPLMMMILMPLYGLLLWLFFRRRYKSYMPHFVFAIHIHIFLFLLLALMTLLLQIDGITPYVLWSVFVIMTVYIVVATRNFYGNRWVGSIFRSGFAFYIYLFLCSILMATGIILYLVYKADNLQIM